MKPLTEMGQQPGHEFVKGILKRFVQKGEQQHPGSCATNLSLGTQHLTESPCDASTARNGDPV